MLAVLGTFVLQVNFIEHADFEIAVLELLINLKLLLCGYKRFLFYIRTRNSAYFTFNIK